MEKRRRRFRPPQGKRHRVGLLPVRNPQQASEHIGFLATYATASVVTIGLIIGYSSHLLDKKKRVVFFAGLLTLLYGCLYVLLELEDLALLIGVLVLLVVLGLLMFITRKIDWYSVRLKGNGA